MAYNEVNFTKNPTQGIRNIQYLDIWIVRKRYDMGMLEARDNMVKNLGNDQVASNSYSMNTGVFFLSGLAPSSAPYYLRVHIDSGSADTPPFRIEGTINVRILRTIAG